MFCGGAEREDLVCLFVFEFIGSFSTPRVSKQPITKELKHNNMTGEGL